MSFDNSYPRLLLIKLMQLFHLHCVSVFAPVALDDGSMTLTIIQPNISHKLLLKLTLVDISTITTSNGSFISQP